MPLVYAHRGARRQAPENTLRAFSRALALGADGVELDVRRTRDAALVVRHDAEGPAGPWAEVTLDEAKASEPDLPELWQALDVCAGGLVNIEIKNSPRDPDWDPSDRVAELVVRLLLERNRGDRVLVSSFNLTTIDRVRSLAPSVPTALLTSIGDPLQDLLTAEAHGHAALHPSIEQLPGPTAGAVTARAHEGGVGVNVWTVNDPDDMVRLAAVGVDGIFTDVPDVAVSVLARPA
jgi:glycerophosphoryl diester phosphodiesterase